MFKLHMGVCVVLPPIGPHPHALKNPKNHGFSNFYIKLAKMRIILSMGVWLNRREWRHTPPCVV